MIDTNAPVVGQLANRPELSSDAAVDTVRVDMLDRNGQPYDYREFVTPEPIDWPISFGVVGDQDALVRVRIRAFRSKFSKVGWLRGVSVIEPIAELTTDRLVFVEPPSDGIRIVEVVLDADCLGKPTKFTQPEQTCIDALHPTASPSEGTAVLATQPASTRVGSWVSAIEEACTLPSEPGKVCIPGGMSVLGDLTLVQLNGVSILDGVPLHPVVVSPFWMDETEFTVGRYRGLATSNAMTKPPPRLVAPNSADALCTYAGLGDSSNDDLPLNCISFDAAAEACEKIGGSLPTEAQWEHAGRGRGESRTYPWGQEAPSCCRASLARTGHLSAACPGRMGPEPVGSHRGTDACGGDVSRDGILDMGGSMLELTQDSFASYDHDCWGKGLLVNPACHVVGEGRHVARGGDWASGFGFARAAWRRLGMVDSLVGFRCVYSDKQGQSP